MENLGTLVLAVGALGTAAFGIVEALKWTPIGLFGFGQIKPRYGAPSSKGARVKLIGPGYHVASIRAPVVGRISLVEIDADHWKTFLHDRLSTPIDKPGAMQLFHAAPREHITLARQLTAEKPEEVFRPGQQPKRGWKRVYYRNHWFDAAYLACVAGHLAGVRLASDPEPVARTPQSLSEYVAKRKKTARRGRRR